MTRRLIPALALVLTACGGAYMDLSPEYREPFDRCWSAMEEPICGRSSDGVYLGTCRRQSANEWASLEYGAPRDEWLLANGCPASQVLPAETRAAVVGEATP